MINVKLSDDKKKILIEADIETLTPSASGKTLVVASSRGNLKTNVIVPGAKSGLVVGLNCYVAKE